MRTIIDLISDTTTQPSAGMRAFMAQAPVGDEQRQEDPSVNALQDRVAALLGKEAALYLPSATMANEIAVKVHTQPGDAVILEEHAHIVTSEAGGPALLSGVMLHTVTGLRGVFTADQVEQQIKADNPHSARTRLVCVEQTCNYGGGTVWPIDRLRAVAETAHRRGLRTHMDGSRLLNAVVASGVPAADHARGYDSVILCLTKGLGCPVGALVAGDRAFIKEARRFKHLFGGAMRQAGIIAAAGVYALDHHVERLAVDHTNAKILARGLAEIRGVGIDVEHVETNIVFFDVAGLGITAQEAAARLLAGGVRVGATGRTRIRAVTHLDVTQSDIERAVEAAQAAFGKAKAGTRGAD
ncbi:MAG TPA: GntG family PLP-dependent aldolase [bacterium]|nr:GntG family PLP-dependent aldolase [bacterium]